MSLAYQVNKTIRTAIIYYEDDCGFCMKASTCISKLLFITDSVRILPASKNKEAEKVLKRFNSWVVEEGNTYTIEYEAFLSLVILSPWARYLYYLFTLPFPKKIGRKVYRWIGNNRPKTCHDIFQSVESKKKE